MGKRGLEDDTQYFDEPEHKRPKTDGEQAEGEAVQMEDVKPHQDKHAHEQDAM